MFKKAILLFILSLKLFHVPGKTFFKINVKQKKLNCFHFQSQPALSEAHCALLCKHGCGIFYYDEEDSLCFTAQGVWSELENDDDGDVKVFATEEGIPSISREICSDGCSCEY